MRRLTCVAALLFSGALWAVELDVSAVPRSDGLTDVSISVVESPPEATSVKLSLSEPSWGMVFALPLSAPKITVEIPPGVVHGSVTLLDSAGYAIGKPVPIVLVSSECVAGVPFDEDRRLDSAVVHHARADDVGSPLSERLLLFLALPFLVGLVLGSALRRRRR